MWLLSAETPRYDSGHALVYHFTSLFHLFSPCSNIILLRSPVAVSSRERCTRSGGRHSIRILMICWPTFQVASKLSSQLPGQPSRQLWLCNFLHATLHATLSMQLSMQLSNVSSPRTSSECLRCRNGETIFCASSTVANDRPKCLTVRMSNPVCCLAREHSIGPY